MNYNRLNESLKLIEDFIRFSIENRSLLTMVRGIRMRFLDVKKRIPLSLVIQERASGSDPGRSPAFDRSPARRGLDIIIANMSRAKESARILEEILKGQDMRSGVLMKDIRFRLYDLEHELYATFSKCFNPSLCAILDEKYIKPVQLERDVKAMIKYGVTMLQLRAHDLPDRAFYRFAKKIMTILAGSKVVFIVNNRIDIARACHAHGIHLGQSDIPVRIARNLVGDNFIIGASARTLSQVRKAQHEGADYLGVGAVFPTTTKANAKVIGLRGLQRICKIARIPVIGIGGIDNRNYRSVLRVGASGIAVSAYLFQGSLKQNIRSLTGKRV